MHRPLPARLMLMALAIGACGTSPAADRTINVLAAASLREPFAVLERQFEKAEPGTDVVVSLGPSSGLVRQVADGAPADVLATADEATMATLGSRAGAARLFSTNRLALLVAEGNPRNLHSLADLDDPSLVVVLCAPEVPCGRLAADAAERAGVDIRPRSFEPDVRGVVAKVSLKEADAGIGYVTDGRGAEAPVDAVALPPEEQVVVRQPILALGPQGQDFVDLVLSEAGRRAMADAGFGLP